MQIFKLRRGDIEHGMTSISREFFEIVLGEIVLTCETEGLDVVVAVAGKITRSLGATILLLGDWKRYYQANRYRFDFETYILQPVGARMDMYDNTKGEKFRLAIDLDPGPPTDAYSWAKQRAERDKSDPKNEYQARLKKEVDTTSYLINQRREVLYRSWA